MKKALIFTVILAFFAATCCTVSAQTTTPNPTDYMSEDARAAYVQDLQIDKQLEQIEDIGKLLKKDNLGKTINESLMGVVESANEFGKTEVGKFTMVLIAWKVMGKDVIRIVLGIIFLIMFTWLLIYSFKRTCIERRVTTKRTNPGFMRYPKEKEYKIIEPLFGDGEGLGAIRLIHLGLFLIGIWITYGIMFAG